MKNFLTSVALAIVLTLIVLAWLAFREGIFDSPEALDQQAEGLDGGALEQWPFLDAGLEDAGIQDASVQDAGLAEPPAAEGPSLGLGGVARLSANKLSIDDKQKRNVLRARHVRASINLRAMRKGAIQVPRGHLEGVELTLYRDKTGKISIASTFRGPEPEAPPRESPEEPP